MVVPIRKEAHPILTGNHFEDLRIIQTGKGNASTWGEEDSTNIGRGQVGHPRLDILEQLVAPVEAHIGVPGVWFSSDEAGEFQGAEGLRLLEDTARRAEADQDLGYAKEETLEIEF